MTDPAADDQTLMATLRLELQDCAAAGETVTYQEVARRTSIPGPHTIHRLTLLLEAMVREDHAACRPLLATVAVSRTTGIPGRGFFQLLTELGRYDGPDQGPEAAAQHARELEAALAQWAKGRHLDKPM
jgi:hypothetical protein